MAGSVAAKNAMGPMGNARSRASQRNVRVYLVRCHVLALVVRGAAVSPQKLANVSASIQKDRPHLRLRRESNLKAVGFCVQRTAGRPRDRHHKHSTSAAGR